MLLGRATNLATARNAEALVLRTLRACHRARRSCRRAGILSSASRPAFRAVFISDVHLGLRASQTEAFRRLLETHSAASIYLVGDIVDLWALERRPRTDRSVPRLLDTFERLAAQGTRIMLIPGNHDAALRARVGRGPGLELHRELIHRDARGRRFLVTHGDEADQVVTCHPALSRFGAALYDLALALSVGLNRARRMLGLRHWNLAGALKRVVKRACTYISDWEATLARTARERGLDGVICGHIHVPRIGTVAGLPYFNCGDWVEHGTALAETWEGEFLLLGAHDAPAGRRTTFAPLALRQTEPEAAPA